MVKHNIVPALYCSLNPGTRNTQFPCTLCKVWDERTFQTLHGAAEAYSCKTVDTPLSTPPMSLVVMITDCLPVVGLYWEQIFQSGSKYFFSGTNLGGSKLNVTEPHSQRDLIPRRTRFGVGIRPI